MISNFRKKLENMNFIPKNKDVIEKTGFNTSDVSKYMSGKREPSKNFLKKFCEVYELDINMFIEPTESEWKEKYYQLLEKYNECLEASAGIKSKVSKSGKPIVNAVDKPELKK